ncbi:origin recognition complex subunit [Culex quinquefasciatus]|uniref:Origin recognition complex subunit n=1 Tax=Culex quinquefasciatus TaxID=7176 RepID=B0WF24_CULQU|nr:origin recognition complex subunit [Culex quinquefasciatus]|eukprot:XP_001847308.1 origin recognition complex subunit [Culex quinquefasciatus]
MCGARAKGRRRDEESPKAILNRLIGHVPCAANGYASLSSVDSMKDVVAQLARLSPSRSYIVVLENADRVRDMDHNVLPMLLRLPKYFVRTGLAPVVKLFVAEYSKKDILVIMMNDFEAVREQLRIELESYKHANLSEEEIDKHLKIVEMLTPDFYENYLNIFLNVFFKVCRDLKELQLVALECFHKYCEPVLGGTKTMTMKLALGTIYMRMENVNQELLRPITVDDQTTSESVEKMQTMKRLAQTLELPFYAKFLLIAAYLASHKAAKEDKRLFMKYHGKTEGVHHRPAVGHFYAILDEKVGLTCNLLAQISTLIHLKFLNFASSEGTIMDGSMRLQCTVGMDFIVACSGLSKAPASEKAVTLEDKSIELLYVNPQETEDDRVVVVVVLDS